MVFNILDPLFEMERSDRNNETVFGEMSAHGIDNLGALAHQQITSAKDKAARLIDLALNGDKPHRRTRGSLTNRFSVSCIVFLPLHERLDVTRRDQPYVVTELSNLASPMMAAATCFERHQTGRLRREKTQQLCPRDLFAEHDISRSIRSTSLKSLLCDTATFVGLIYMARIMSSLRKEDATEHRTDSWYYGAAPFACYMGLAAIAAGVWFNVRIAPASVGTFPLVLLLPGIRNAWDLVTGIAPRVEEIKAEADGRR